MAPSPGEERRQGYGSVGRALGRVGILARECRLPWWLFRFRRKLMTIMVRKYIASLAIAGVAVAALATVALATTGSNVVGTVMARAGFEDTVDLRLSVTSRDHGHGKDREVIRVD